MADIRINTNSLNLTHFLIPELNAEPLDGSNSPLITLQPGEYTFQIPQVLGLVANFKFQVTADGLIDYAAEYAVENNGFLDGRGTTTLIVRGFTITLNATALSQDLQLNGLIRDSVLSRQSLHQLTLIPGTGYSFRSAPDLIAAFQFDIDLKGHVVRDDRYRNFADTDGSSLTLNGYRITIDAGSLSHDLGLYLLGNSDTLSRHLTHPLTLLPTHEETLPPGGGYTFQAAPDTFAYDYFRFGINLTGQIVLADHCEGFAQVNGRSLKISGYRITVDGRSLSHDLGLYLIGNDDVLTRDRTHDRTLLPSKGYSFQVTPDIRADFKFDLTNQGEVIIPSADKNVAVANGQLLTLNGYRITLDARSLSHDLGLYLLGNMAFRSRDLTHELALLPAGGYRFQPATVLLNEFRFNLTPAGQVSVATRFASFARVEGRTLILGIQRLVTGRIVPPQQAPIDLEAGRIEVYDRNLPSLEARGTAPQRLGQSAIDKIDHQFKFRIQFSDDPTRPGEGEGLPRQSHKVSPDLSFRVFDPTGRELKIAYIQTLAGGASPANIVFNAPVILEEVEIGLEPISASGDSEYEQLIAAIAPMIADLPLAGLTEQDEVFLIHELGITPLPDLPQKIQWLRRSARLAEQTQLPIAAFYGWGRKNLPNDFAELASSDVAELPARLSQIVTQDDAVLRQTLQTAIAEHIIPDLSDRMAEILAQIEQLRIRQGLLTSRRFIGKLLNAANSEPLVGLTVQGFDLEAGDTPKDLGQAVSNNIGVFSFHYITPPLPAGGNPEQSQRRLRLRVVLNPATQETFETEVLAGGDQEILDVPVPMPVAPTPEVHQLENLVPALGLDLPPMVLPFLAAHNITTLADIRHTGGIAGLEGLPIAPDHPAVHLLEAHADLNRVSADVALNTALIERRYDSVAAIAQATRPEFVSAIHEQVGDFKAAQIQVAARAQTQFLNQVIVDLAAHQGNGIAANQPALAEHSRCHCRDCEAAVSPLAYLADLLKYATENIKNNNVAIKASDLAAMFHQPFDLPASCEAADTPVRQVRLCIEVLRSYLGARPLGDDVTETRLAAAERQYRLAAYTTLLTKLGTSYAELRLSRSREQIDRQSLADRLGIDLSYLSELFLEPETLTEAQLEQRLGLVDTTRAPFTPVPTSDLQTWRLAYLRTLWQQQDFPTDPYEEGQTTVPLQQLPADLLFPPPLDAHIRYNPDRQQLVFQGVMTLDDRQTLLSLSPEPNYQQAVKHLFQSSQRLPLIDPDLLRPEDFRRPLPKANPDAPPQAFDLWQTRRDWVSDRLQFLANLTKALPDEAEPIPDLAALFDALYQPVPYGASSVTPWASTTPSTEFAAFHDQLKQGIDVPTLTFRLQDDLNLSVEQFTRLMEIGKKAQAWEADTRHEKVKPEEWQAVYSILIQAQKVKLFAVWRKEEQEAGVQLDAHTFWIALRPLPEEQLTPWSVLGEARHRWQQTLRDRMQPALIDPDLIGLADLKHREGDPAYDLWNARNSEVTTQLAQLAAAPQDLAGLETNFQAILGISVPQFLAIAADQAKGHGVSNRLAQLSLEGAEFNHLLRIARLVGQSQPILPEEWEAVYSILVQVWKRRQFAQWRTAEKAQNITLSPDFFQIAFPVAPPTPTVNAGWRSSIVAYRDWQDKLQARIDQENTTLQAMAEAVSTTEEATLTQLRDGLILAISQPGDLEIKAKWVAENLLIDAKMSACSMTTRVAQAIETLQGLILALRTGQLEERYRTLQLNPDNFEEKWKWLGSYASWRAAMFVFLYPENILQPSLRKWQTPAFESLVRNTSANRKLTPKGACQEAKKYAEYFQDICTLTVEASCTARTRMVKSDGCSQADRGYRCFFYMFGRGGLTGQVYWSIYDFQDDSAYSQTFWIPIRGADGNTFKDLENVEEIIGAVPYQTSLNERFIFVFGRKKDGLARKIVCAKYDLEHLSWQSELISVDVSAYTSGQFNAIVKQQDFEDSPPHLAVSNGNKAFEVKISADGKNWESQTPYPIIATSIPPQWF